MTTALDHAVNAYSRLSSHAIEQGRLHACRIGETSVAYISYLAQGQVARDLAEREILKGSESEGELERTCNDILDATKSANTFLELRGDNPVLPTEKGDLLFEFAHHITFTNYEQRQ